MDKIVSIKPATLVLLAVASFIFCFYHTFGWFHYRYSTQDSYFSHGYLIPFVSAYLIYLDRDYLRRIEKNADIRGMAIILVSLMLHFIATMGDVNFISGYAMLLYLSGVLLYLYGSKTLRRLSFPLFFLVFMLPIPNTWLNSIGLPTKAFATSIGLHIIDVLDIPFFREGFQIQLPNTILVVGTPCNGMKSLIAFAALGVLLMHLMHTAFYKRLIVLASLYPLSIFLNGVRIAILVLIAHYFGLEKAAPESFYHGLSGAVVFILGLLVLFPIVKWVNRNAFKLPQQ
jgi:exosortase